MKKKFKTERQYIERDARRTGSKKTPIDEEELARFLKGGLAAK
jgi:hypothetical protein